MEYTEEGSWGPGCLLASIYISVHASMSSNYSLSAVLVASLLTADEGSVYR